MSGATLRGQILQRGLPHPMETHLRAGTHFILAFSNQPPCEGQLFSPPPHVLCSIIRSLPRSLCGNFRPSIDHS